MWRHAISRSGSYSTTLFLILYVAPFFMSMPNSEPSSSRSGPETAPRTVPDPSMRACWRGSARIAKTTAGGAAIVALADVALRHAMPRA